MKTDVFEILSDLEAVVPLHLRRGQVLVHEGHVPMGIYYLHTGTIDVVFASSREGGRGRKAHHVVSGPLMFPRISELDTEAGCTITTAMPVHVLFIPRSVILLNSDIHDTVRELNVKKMSLVSIRDQQRESE
ncbi:MAG: cyclic nucleotide-binding domain-containing protein [Myxococcales bacterium]|nr:cyclic nucleotide-binding domain-containing protein [Myxococcales bacterium]